VDTAEVRDPRENNVAKLFNRSKLVKSRLVQELSSQVAQLSFFVVSWVNWPQLEVRNEAWVFVFGIFDFNIDSLLTNLQIDNFELQKVSRLRDLKIKNLACLFDSINSRLCGYITEETPDHTTRNHPIAQIILKSW